MRAGSVLLGTFEIRRLLSRGAHAEVYEAFDQKLERPVCIKVLPSGSDNSARYREARAAANLTSPHTVRVYYCGDLPGGSFFVMEWSERGSLRDLLAQAGRALGPADVQDIVVQVARSLAEAHGRGLVHRDVKPSNILLFGAAHAGLHVKLADFGIALPFSHAGQEVGLAGTPAYMAPELWGGSPASPQSDLYALGVTAFELLVGQKPFSGSRGSLRHAHQFVTAPPLSTLAPSAPPLLVHWVTRCLEKEPSNRPHHAAELIEALLPFSPAPRSMAARLVGGERVLVSTHTAASTVTDGSFPPAERPAATLMLRERRVAAMVQLRAAPEMLSSWKQCAARYGATPARNAREVWVFGGNVPQAELAVEPIAAAVQCIESWCAAEGHKTPWSAALRAGHALIGAEGDAQEAGQSPAAVAVSDAAVAELRELLGAHPHGGIVLSAAAWRWLEQGYRLELEAAVAQALSRPGASPPRHQRGAPGPPRLLATGSPDLIGRAAELEALEVWARESLEGGPASMAFVLGEAGIGKSRLRHALMCALERSHPAATVVCVAALPEDEGGEAALRRLASALFHLEPGLSRAEVAARVQARLSQAGALGAAALARDLATALTPHTQVLDEPARTKLGMDAALWGDIAAALCAERPQVWLIEDAHWADSGSLSCLAQTVRQTQGAPLAVLCFARPEGLSESAPRALRLEPLAAASAAMLVRSQLARVSGVPEGLVRAIADASGGVPLFAEEAVRLLLQSEHVVSTPDGQYRLHSHMNLPRELSLGLRSILEGRLARLSADLRFAARVLAVLGRGLPPWAMEWVAGLEPGTLAPRFEALAAHGVLVHQPASPSANAFEFGHRLLEEAAYESADVRDRGRWHERAARWLEGVLHAAPNHNTARWTAQHWERAGRLARAVSAYRRAATLARSSYAMAEADSLLARAQVLAHAMGGGPALLDVLYDRVRVAEFRSDAAAVDELLGLLEAALPDARLSAEQLAVWGATLAYTRAVAAVRRKDVPAALELTLRGLVLLEAAPRAKSARLLRARLGNWQGWCLLRLNRPADAQRAYAEALQSLGKRGSERERSTLQSALALALQRAGAPDETVRRSHERAIRTKERLAATTGDKKPLGAARINYACYLLEKGRMEWALRELAQAQSIAAAIGDPEMEAVVEVNLAECHLGCRRAADALRHLDRATRVATAHALHWVLAETQALVSRAREAVK